jgi:hypothetical protein
MPGPGRFGVSFEHGSADPLLPPLRSPSSITPNLTPDWSPKVSPGSGGQGGLGSGEWGPNLDTGPGRFGVPFEHGSADPLLPPLRSPTSTTPNLTPGWSPQTPSGSGGQGPGWWEPVLLDPGALARRLLSGVAAWWSVWGPWLVVAAAAVAALVVAGATVVAARRRQRWARGASWVEITAGPQVDADGAELLWRTLSGLSRPRWSRLLHGQPHLVWEIHAGAGALRLGVWVPSAVRVGIVTAAVRAAWPGARTCVTTIPEAVHHAAVRTLNSARSAGRAGSTWPIPIPRHRPGQQQAVAAGRLHLQRPEALPLRTNDRADPLRALLGALEAVREHTDSTDPADSGGQGESSGSEAWGCVQVCVRPIVAWRAALSRHAAGRVLAGTTPGWAATLAAGTVSGSSGMAAAAVVWLLRGCGLAVRELLRGAGSVAATPLSRHSGYGHGGHGGRGGYGAGGYLDRSRRGDRKGGGLAPAISRAVHDKTDHGPYWAVQIRYAATLTTDTSSTDSRAYPGSTSRPVAAAERVAGWADGIGAAFAVLTGANLLRRRGIGVEQAREEFNQRRMGLGQLWSVPELAAIAHLPLSPRVPGLVRAGAAAVPVPPGVPTGGRDTRPIGLAQVSGRPVALPVTDARHHAHVIGVTGVGKSWFIAGNVLADVDAARGVIVLDPKGDLAADIAARTPASHRDRLVMLDPVQHVQPPMINLLDPRYPAGVDHLTHIFKRLFGDNWGPRTDDIARLAGLTLRAHHRYLTARARASSPGRVVVPVPHLGDLLTLISDPEHRRGVVAAMVGTKEEMDMLRPFWRGFDELPASTQAAVVAPLSNKLRALLLRPFPASVLTGTPYHPHDHHPEPGPAPTSAASAAPRAGREFGGPGRELDMTTVLDHGGIVLARLPEGLLSAETTQLLGSIVVAHTWHALTARAARPEHERPDASLYLDEAQMFLHMPVRIEELLAQARALHLSVTCAHQNLAQLSVELRAGLSANALNKFYLRTAPEDAAALERHVTPNLSAHDLAHLDPYTLAARLHLSNTPTPAFTVRTHPLEPATASDPATSSDAAGPGAGHHSGPSGAPVGRAA